MQVTETQAQGLRREFKVVFAAAELAQRLDEQLTDLKGKVRINGFRPGKVPIGHLKRVYGRSVMADVVKDAVNEANRKIVDDNGLRLAGEPKIEFPEDQAELQKAFAAEGDLAFVVNLEVLPKFEIGGFEDVEVERLTRRGRRGCGRQGARRARRAKPALRPEGRRRGEGRQGHDRFRRQDRRRSFRTRLRHRCRGDPRLGFVPARLRRAARGDRAGRGAPRQSDVSGELRGSRSRRQGGRIRR